MFILVDLSEFGNLLCFRTQKINGMKKDINEYKRHLNIK